MAESPDFKKMEDAGEVAENPVIDALRNQPRQIAHVGALVVLMGGGFYMLFVWWPTYLSTIVSPAVPHALLVNTLAMTALAALIPLAGLVSDRVGRKRLLLAAHLGFIALAYPLFAIADHGVMLVALGCQLVFALLMSGVQGPMPAAMVEMFPTKTRFSGVAMGYNISLALFGGTAPLVCTWLISWSGDLAAPAYYLMAMAAVSLVAVSLLRVPQGKTLR